MKVYLPSAKQCSTENGIGRIVHAQEKYLPLMGIQFVADPSMADICIYHAGTARVLKKRN